MSFDDLPLSFGASGEPSSLPDYNPPTQSPKRRTRKSSPKPDSSEPDAGASGSEAPEHEAEQPTKRSRRRTKAPTAASDGSSSAGTTPDIGFQTFLEDGTPVPRADERSDKGKPWPEAGQEILKNFARFPGCIVLTRMGNFYEAYFEQAPLLASMLGIKLTTRVWSEREVYMSGFPLSQLDKYLKILVENHRQLVAICEEFRIENGEESPNPYGIEASEKNALATQQHKEIRRRVTRVVSPGTLLDESWMDPLKSNFVLSVSLPTSTDAEYGLAWLDLGTSDFHVTRCSDLRSLRDEVKRIAPTEVVLEKDIWEADAGHDRIHQAREYLWQAFDPERTFVTYVAPDQVPVENGTAPGVQETVETTGSYSAVEFQAIRNLTRHLRSRLLEIFRRDGEEHGGYLDFKQLAASGMVQHHLPGETMAIDANTLDSLEIRETTREGGTRGSLYSTVRRTVTKAGSRLLSDWLTAPSTSLSLIQSRHAAVSYLCRHPTLHEDLRLVYRQVQRGDIPRTLRRILTARSNEQDLLEIRDFIKFTHDLSDAIERDCAESGQGSNEVPEGLQVIRDLTQGMADLSELGRTLEEAIDEVVLEKRLRDQEAMQREQERALGQEDEDAVEKPTKGPKTKRIAEVEAQDHMPRAPLQPLIRRG